jgi:hypothetical protein
MILVEEIHFIFDALLIQRLQNHVTGAVSGMTGAPHRFLAKIAGVTAKTPLADAPF